MATIIMSAIPGHREPVSGSGFSVTVLQIMGERLGHDRGEARSLDQIKALVKGVGERIAEQHSERSFLVLVSVAKGSRKPGGFDAADKRNAFGQDHWMKTIEKRDPLTPGVEA